MSHADDGQLNALLDGELSEREARAVESHVAQCAECRRRLEEARAFLREAGALLESLGPVAAHSEAPVVAAAPQSSPPPGAPAQPPRPISKTAREVAIEIDGRTAKTPAIRPVFPDEVPPAARPRRGWDLEKLAWAASIVLALGVGYLANESLRMHQLYNDATAARQAERPSQPATQSSGRTATPTPAPQQVASVPRRAPPTSRSSGPHVDAVRSRRGAASAVAALRKPRTARVKAPSAQPPRTEVANAVPTGAAGVAQGGGLTPAPVAPASAPSAPAAGAPGMARASAPPAPMATRSLTTNRVAADEASSRAALAFQPITMVEAVRRLSGSIRQVDNMRLLGIGVASGQLVGGADPTRDVVRATYADRQGRHFTLDQQLAEPRQGPSFSGIMPGDTLVTVTPDGSARVRWMDGRFWLSLAGAASVEEVRAALARVR